MSNNSGFIPKNGQSTGYNSQNPNDMRNMTSSPVGPSLQQQFSSLQNGQSPDATVRINNRNMPPNTAPVMDQRPMGSPIPSTPPAPQRPDQKKPGAFKNRRLAIVGAVVSGIVIVALVVLAVIGLNGGQTDVTLYQAGTKNVSSSIGGGGITFPLQQINISYPSAETVVKIPVKAGDQVTNGQPVIQLDPTQLNLSVKQASDNVSAAQAFLNSVSAAGNAVAIADAQKQYDDAKNRYNALVAQSASPLLHNGNIISPMNGIVTAINVNPGETFASGATLVTVMDETTEIVHVKIPLANLQQVHVGQTATVTPSALPNTDLAGTVISVVPVADPQTDTFEVWVQVKNDSKVLLPGMSAFVRIQSTPARAIAVPRLAVVDPQRDSVVFVVRNQHAHIQHVHILGRSAENIFIDQGLLQNDTVVLTGIQNLKDGQSVRVIKVEQGI